MAWLGTLLGGGAKGVGEAVATVAGAFGANREASAARAADSIARASTQFGKEFGTAKGPWGALVDALNRLPRPLIALGTIGLFVYAMVDPTGFAERMQALDLIPAELWWLLGSIVAFFFGGRELHHRRAARGAASVVADIAAIRALDRDDPTPPAHDQTQFTGPEN